MQSGETLSVRIFIIRTLFFYPVKTWRIQTSISFERTSSGILTGYIYEKERINGSNLSDIIICETDDHLHSGNKNNIILAGAGDDIIYGGQGKDTIYGEESIFRTIIISARRPALNTSILSMNHSNYTHLGSYFKKLGYAGVIASLKEGSDSGSVTPIYKYVLGTALSHIK